MCTADSSPLRQMAAVELRKRTQKWWPQVDEPTQTSIKQTLLDFALAEEEQRVRHAVARVITSVAKVEVPAGKWNELLQYLYSSCQSAKVGHREVVLEVVLLCVDLIYCKRHSLNRSATTSSTLCSTWSRSCLRSISHT